MNICTCSGRRPFTILVIHFLFIVMFFLRGLSVLAGDKRWVGAAGDGLWSNPVNWNESVLPAAGDDVVLDNSSVPVSYNVILPDGQVQIKTLKIEPSLNLSIQLTLPATNLYEPALALGGPGYGLVLGNGAVFMNASGLASGESLVIADSMLIANGGKYIHHTRAAHANNIVRILSAQPGTELGIVEFDVPRSSYTLSASNRIYGSLYLKSQGAGGTVSYTCSGNNPLTVRGNLRISEGVSFTADLSGVNGNIAVAGDYIQDGGVFNLAGGAGNTTKLIVSGNMIQSPVSLITETNTGQPSIELRGETLQVISLAGMVTNDVSLVMNNREGAVLLAPLRLPHKLILLQGKVSSSAANLLTLSPGCTVKTDSTVSNTSFVDGPLRKEGLDQTPFFLFPVGKNRLRWIEMKQATGNFTVEYWQKDPRLLSTQLSSGIDHVSALEYWTVTSDPQPTASAQWELSFADPESGGVTDLAHLLVARDASGVWENAGNSANTGAFGSFGSVVSSQQEPVPAEAAFTLASSLSLQNPLPLKLIDFRANLDRDRVNLFWHLDGDEWPDHFELFQSDNGQNFVVAARLAAIDFQSTYTYTLAAIKSEVNYFRLRVHEKSGATAWSKVIFLDADGQADEVIKLVPSMVQSSASVILRSRKNRRWFFDLISMEGRSLEKYQFSAVAGINSFLLDLTKVSPGIYQLAGYDEKGKRIVVRFVKRE